MMKMYKTMKVVRSSHSADTTNTSVHVSSSKVDVVIDSSKGRSRSRSSRSVRVLCVRNGQFQVIKNNNLAKLKKEEV